MGVRRLGDDALRVADYKRYNKATFLDVDLESCKSLKEALVHVQYTDDERLARFGLGRILRGQATLR